MLKLLSLHYVFVEGSTSAIIMVRRVLSVKVFGRFYILYNILYCKTRVLFTGVRLDLKKRIESSFSYLSVHVVNDGR